MLTRTHCLCIFVFLLGATSPVCAQPLKRAAKAAVQKIKCEETVKYSAALRQAGPAAQNAVVRTVQRPGRAEQNANEQLAAQLQKAAALAARGQKIQETKRMRRSVFMITGLYPSNTTGTGFVFETVYNGKKEIWGVAAAHVTYDLPDGFFTTFFKNNTPYTFFARPVLYGHFHSLDAVLVYFDQSPEFLEVVRPLKLAQHPPAPSETAVSYAFHMNDKRNDKLDFIPGRDRQILTVSPSRLTTSYAFKRHKRKGMCGGPLLNANHEVIAMHTGSFTEKAKASPAPAFLPPEGQPFWPNTDEYGAIGAPIHRISHALPAQRILDLVCAYHNDGNCWRTVGWNEFPVMQLNVNQRLVRVTAWRNEIKLADIQARYTEPFLDEARLEQFVRAEDPDRLELDVETYDSEAEKVYISRVRADLKNKKLSGIAPTETEKP